MNDRQRAPIAKEEGRLFHKFRQKKFEIINFRLYNVSQSNRILRNTRKRFFEDLRGY